MAIVAKYGVTSTKTSNALTQGAGNRASSTGEGVRKWRDSYTTSTWLDTGPDTLYLGPFRAGEVIDGNTLRITGDATLDMGDDVDVGWSYVDGTGTADPDAFVAGTFDCTAATIDVLGVIMHDGTVDSGFYAPPTNDRDWWLTITAIDDTGAADGTVYFTADVVNFC